MKQEAEILERNGELQKVAEIRYSKIPEFEKSIKQEEKKLNELQKKQQILKEEVDEEDMAKVVSRWSGVPVSKMLTAKRWFGRVDSTGIEPALLHAKRSMLPLTLQAQSNTIIL